MRPSIGLAADEVLLAGVRGRGGSCVRFWIDERAVVVGRSQAVDDEVDAAQAAAHGVAILRRISGGGTVYHDPGNLNLSIVAPAAEIGGTVEAVFHILGGAVAVGLRRLCPQVEAEGNGLYIGGRKLGGAAQARRGDAALYHTTVLVRSPEVDLARLLRAMRPGYAPRGVASRPRAVVSLTQWVGREVSMEEAAGAVRDGLEEVLGGGWIDDSWGEAERAQIAALAKTKYEDRQWIHAR